MDTNKHELLPTANHAKLAKADKFFIFVYFAWFAVCFRFVNSYLSVMKN